MPSYLSEHQQQLLDITRHWIVRAEAVYQRHFPLPEIRFDLRGQTAGQYRGGKHPCIRYNMDMASNQFDAYSRRTPGHEVAHYVVDCLYPGYKIRPHGTEWKTVMQAFELEASRCHQYDLKNLPQRKQRRFSYQCPCQEYKLSATRHNRVQFRGVEYRCMKCGEILQQKD
jgi:SprT protein